MIRLDHVCRRYRSRGLATVVADDICATFPSGVAVALLGHNGAGKSSLLRMIAGTMRPDSGRIWSDGTISWPVGFAGSFHGDLTGAQNVRFVARIYGVDTGELEAYVRAFADLGPHFDRPFNGYSAGMRARLAFGTSMGILFDTYLIDEVTSVGDGDFRRRSDRVLQERLGQAGAVVVSHSMPMIRTLCRMGAVLHGGRLAMFEDLEEAIATHEDLLGIPRSRPTQAPAAAVPLRPAAAAPAAGPPASAAPSGPPAGAQPVAAAPASAG